MITTRDNPDDGQVIRQSWDSPEHFRLIFDRHYRDVCRFLSYKTSPTDAEELASEVFITAFKRRFHFRIEEPSARPWLFKIAMNLVLRSSRSTSRRNRAYGRLRSLRHNDEPGPDAVLKGLNEGDSLSTALAAIPDSSRDVVLLVAGAGFSYEEAALTLNIPVGTVRSRYSRARSRLQDLLTPTSAGEHS